MQACTNDVGAKTKAEIATLGHLHTVYEILATSDDLSSPIKHEQSVSVRPHTARENQRLESRFNGGMVDKIRGLRHHSISTSRLSTTLDVNTNGRVEQWLVLERLERELLIDQEKLQQEIQYCELRTKDICRLPIDMNELEPKWQVLYDLMGQHTFDHYVRDLHTELRQLRSRSALYGLRMVHFQDLLKKQYQVRDVVTHTEWLDVINTALQAIDPETNSILISQYPVLVQHCSDVHKSELIVLSELHLLLHHLSPPRERLTRICFEQVTDRKRGDPPPDTIPSHKLMRLVKERHVEHHCSQEERDEVIEWLTSMETSVTMDHFVHYHVKKSDLWTEDAEYLTFLIRVWGFSTQPLDAYSNVLGNYEIRCRHLSAKTRKLELLQKVDDIVATSLPRRLEQLRCEVASTTEFGVGSHTTPVEFRVMTRSFRIEDATRLLPVGMPALKVLCLSNLELDDFPAFIVKFQQLEILDLRDNRLKGVLPLGLGNLDTLKTLILQQNQLHDKCFPISPSINAWSSLTTLDLSMNRLQVLPPALMVLPVLRSLSLAKNQLRSFGTPEDWMKTTCRLQTLDIRENQLTFLPNEMFEKMQESLEYFYVQHNKLTTLPSSFMTLQQLQECALDHNTLDTMDETTFFQHLKHLHLESNHLRVFPMIQKKNNGIETIHFSKNRLQLLPALEPLWFSSCHELELQKNRISDISESFFIAFPLLRVCKLQQNKLKHLPTSIVHCRHLQVLELYENQLEKVPSELCQLQELTRLNLRENQITSVPTEWHVFSQYLTTTGHRRLELVHLQKNPIKNKVLNTLIHSQLPTYKTSDTNVCEIYFRKLIDLLKQSQAIQTLERAVEKQEMEEKTRKWKGKTRYVTKHLEIKLLALSTDRKTLRLSIESFQGFLRGLPVAGTKREVECITTRFLDQPSAMIDGQRFLYAIEMMGQQNALEPPTDGGRCDTVRKPIDTVGSILQFLRAAHEHKLRPPSPPKWTEPLKQSPPTKPTRPRSAHVKSRTTVNHSKNTQPPAVNASKNQQDLQIERQRQRIQVLEQQLMDQQLLRLCQQAQTTTHSNDIISAAGLDRNGKDASSNLIMIHVKRLENTLKSTLPIIAIAPNKSVYSLKQVIQEHINIPVHQQVLVARRTRDGKSVRLCNDCSIAEYVGNANQDRWVVSLIVGDLLQIER